MQFTQHGASRLPLALKIISNSPSTTYSRNLSLGRSLALARTTFYSSNIRPLIYKNGDVSRYAAFSTMDTRTTQRDHRKTHYKHAHKKGNNEIPEVKATSKFRNLLTFQESSIDESTKSRSPSKNSTKFDSPRNKLRNSNDRSRDDDLNLFNANGSQKQHDEQYQSTRKKKRPMNGFLEKPNDDFSDRFDDSDENARNYAPSAHSRDDRTRSAKPKKSRSLLKNFNFEYSIFDKNADLFDHVEWKRNTKQSGISKNRPNNHASEPMRTQNGSHSNELREIEIPPHLSVKELASRMSTKCGHVLRILKDLGERRLNEDSIIANHIAELAVESMNMIPVLLPPEFVDAELTIPPEDCSAFPVRPPVVCVMGHVDHGKTTLLDTLRKSNVTASEYGGITQKIGAFSVNLGKSFGEQSTMTFLDTPGHSVFSGMRSRGVEATDMILLIVAADDGIQSQTIEVVEQAVKNGICMIVAITKCDMHGSDEQEAVQRISAQLMKYGVTTENLGGDTPVICVSGKTGDGLDLLKETIALHTEMKDLRADHDAKGEAIVLEAQVARGAGTQVDAVVKWGTLRPGSHFTCGLEHGKIKALLDQNQKQVKRVTPGHPVRLIGLKNLPMPGDALIVAESEERAREIVTHRRELIEWNLLAEVGERMDNSNNDIKPQGRRRFMGMRKKWEEVEMRRRRAAEEEKRLASLKFGDKDYVAQSIPILVKTDSVGTFSAIDELIATLPTDEVAIKRIASDIGTITSSDITVAETTGAIIYAFDLKQPTSIEKEAMQKNVSIRSHNIIYHLLEDIKGLLQQNLAQVVEKNVVGSAEVLQAIAISGSSRNLARVAGCRVIAGKLNVSSKFRLLRNGTTLIDDLSVRSMQHFQDQVNEISKGHECGLRFDGLDDFEPGDIIEAYTTIVVKKQVHI
uniref:Translation initiation factor IF2 putative n=1 Tax=Albugo laibachii Nc14 TaxID=890382 RepID=F0WC79_9STRA|nr:translation initiation factor IF2 putative [Albugo laibachii Nc14]|eukprot:CCA18792.1 translation initiation factor IF2 putative [Albugo laibachii Nc14]